MPITKAILTGGGRATRLRPITTTINKHLIPLANEPMIFYAIKKVVEAGVTDIYININPEETELPKAVGDGSRWGVNITYFVQEGGPQGIAHVVNCAKKFIGKDPFIFYLSDNIILGSIKPAVDEFNKGEYDCMLAFSKVQDPERFGVPVFDDAGVLVDVVEKPKNPPNNFAVTGIYLYGPKIFFEAFDHIDKSARGEYEISDIHSYFLKKGMKVGWKEITGWWKDTGKPADLIAANQLLLDELPAKNFKQESSTEGISLSGNVQVGSGTTFGKNVSLVGPVMIGADCHLENCTVGPYVTIGSGSSIKNSSINNSIIFALCSLDADITITESIIGEKAAIMHTDPADKHQFILGDHTSIAVK